MKGESAIISLVMKIWTVLKTAYDNSVYLKLFDKFADWLGKLYKNSFLYGFFSQKKTDAKESGFVRLINAFMGLFHSMFHKTVRKIGAQSRRSIVMKNIAFILNYWYAISVKHYSIALAAFVGFRLIIKRFMSQMVGPYTVALLAVAALGIFIDVTLAELYEGSKLKKIVGLPELSGNVILRRRIKPHKAVTVALVIGSIAGIVTVVAEGWLIIGGFIALAFLIAKPMLGVCLIAAGFPFIPTMGVVALGLYLLFVLFIKYLYGENKIIKIDTFDIGILAMCAVLAYGVANSFAPADSILPVAVYMVFVSSFFVIRRMLGEKDFFKNILNLIILASVAVSLYGLYQKVTGQDATTWQDTDMFEEMGGRIFSTFGNPNVFGEYLLIVMPITFAFVLTNKEAKMKTLYFIAFALQAICMVLTYSRGCWIGIALAMGLMLIFTRRKISSLFIFAVFLLPFVMPETVIQRIMSIGDVSDSSTSYRVFIWQGTLKLLKDFWYSGVGIGEGAFAMVYPHYSLNGIVAPHSHNLYLHVLSETGIIGFAVVITLVVLFYKYISSAALKNEKYKTLAVALGCSMIGYLAQGMFDNVWYNYRIYFFFFVVLALGATLHDVSAKEAGNDKA